MCTTALFMRESCGQSGDTAVSFSTRLAEITEIPRILACGQDSFLDHLSPGPPMVLQLSWGNTSLDMTPEAVPSRVIHRSHVVVHRRILVGGLSGVSMLPGRSYPSPALKNGRKPQLRCSLWRERRSWGFLPLFGSGRQDASAHRAARTRVTSGTGLGLLRGRSSSEDGLRQLVEAGVVEDQRGVR